MSETPSVYVRRLEARVAATRARVARLVAGRSGDEVASDLRSVDLPWFEVRGQEPGADGDPETATVLIYDEIGGSLGISARQFAEEVDAITAPLIHLRVNSPGGSLFDAIAIHNTLLHHPSRVVAFVDSLAASAASVVVMAGDEVVMMPGSQMMIHDASAVLDGDAADMGKMSTFLDRQSTNVAAMYQGRAGGEVSYWRELMLAETWMFGDEAVELGLADRVHDRPEPASDERMARSFDLSQYRYAGRRAAPAPPVARRAAPTRPATTVTRERVRETASMATPDALREAAAARRQALIGGAAQVTMAMRSAPTPCGRERMVCTGWMRRDGGGAFPQRLRTSTQRRDGKDFHVVEGYATVYERGYEMWDDYGPYEEIVSRGAGEKTVAAKPDVVFLVNHRGVAMARTSAGTLELWSDEVGMGDRAWLNPGRNDVNDLVLGIDDTVITEQSFAFVITAGRWSPDFTQYRIDEYDVDRGDVSAVNFGANPYTSIAARTREILDDLDVMPAGAARAALTRLQRRADLAQASPLAAPAELVPATSPRCVTVTEVDAWLASRDRHPSRV